MHSARRGVPAHSLGCLNPKGGTQGLARGHGARNHGLVCLEERSQHARPAFCAEGVNDEREWMMAAAARGVDNWATKPMTTGASS
eukprot:16440736-Heterocapsa_arctica.AAC.1